MSSFNEASTVLYRKKKTIREAEAELGSKIDEEELFKHMDTCSFCGMWYHIPELEEDNSGFPACLTCLKFYGY